MEGFSSNFPSLLLNFYRCPRGVHRPPLPGKASDCSFVWMEVVWHCQWVWEVPGKERILWCPGKGQNTLKCWTGANCVERLEKCPSNIRSMNHCCFNLEPGIYSNRIKVNNSQCSEITIVRGYQSSWISYKKGSFCPTNSHPDDHAFISL
jgi:hypothetical protein